MAGQGLDWEVKLTQAPGHGMELAQEAARTGRTVRLYACGGDGTLSEVAGGAAGYPNAAVTHYPTGSGNDFIKIFGLDAPLFYDLHELSEGEQAALDLIDCNGRLSVNICSVGFDARIGMGMAAFKQFPFVSGTMAYRLSLVKNFVEGIHRPFKIDVDGERFEGDFTLLAACNGRYYGGSFNPAPQADPDDGLLDFLIVKAVSRFTVAAVVEQYAAGGAASYPEYIDIRRGHAMTVECDRVSAVNVDGERLDADKLSFSLSAKKVNFFFPQCAHWRASERNRNYVNGRK
jgi:diacylglycerol kinase family enzyme